jgi:hypothetical protein
MKLNKTLFFSSFSLFILACVWLYAEEEHITIATYYPSPYGSYRELNTYSNTYLARASGNVGVGTSNPTAKLEVKGGVIKATDGLIIEVVSSDPTSPQEGQLWLNTSVP